MPHTLEDYRVELDAYNGPLDLLLYLVKRHEIDLNDIPIAQLAEQYVGHLKLLKDFDVDLAGEFLVMAATLLEIKSAMLVPRAESDPAEQAASATAENPLDPRYELVQQLLAYKRFKDAANGLESRRQDWEARFARAGQSAAPRKSLAEFEALGEDESAGPVEIDLEDVHVLDLCAAFARILDSIGQNKSHQITYDDTPIALHAEDIADR
jgi:segregation and condensation protein A